jgi:DDE superfamily endonuclease
MILPKLPPPIASFLTKLIDLFDKRNADLVLPLFLGELLAHGRRTATAWFRAAHITDQFRRAYTVLGSLGKSHLVDGATVLFADLRQTIDPGPHWLFALDDTPTQRYGPYVEGAGLHHNPTPGPAQQKFVYGHIWVTTAWVVRHPQWHTLALPLLADLYIREKDVPKIDADRRPDFVTKLELAASQIRWAALQVRGSGKPIWAVVDGFYAKRPVLKEAEAQGVIVVGRLRCDAALRDLPPPPPPPGQRRDRGRPPKYGKRRLSLAKRANHPQGWQEVTCFQYQHDVTKTVKTFLATWRPAGGVIRVVIVKEDDGWRAYLCTDPTASVQDILEAAAGRTAIEDTFKDVKEVEGAGQQQLRYWRANAGAFHWCLWGYTVVEWWAWKKPFEQLVDRSASPWDEAERRPSHANRRKALERLMLEEEFWWRWGERPCPAEIEEMVEALLDRVA